MQIRENFKTECTGKPTEMEIHRLRIIFFPFEMLSWVSVICLKNNYGNEASLWTCSSWIYEKSHLRVWMLKLWSKLETGDFNIEPSPHPYQAVTQKRPFSK